MSALGTAVRRRRMALGIGQATLAREVGVDKAHLCRVEAGARNPSTVLRDALVARLGLEDDAAYALAVTSGRDLLRNYAALTHRIDAAKREGRWQHEHDDRAQRDLIEAELLSRLGEA